MRTQADRNGSGPRDAALRIGQRATRPVVRLRPEGRHGTGYPALSASTQAPRRHCAKASTTGHRPSSRASNRLARSRSCTSAIESMISTVRLLFIRGEALARPCDMGACARARIGGGSGRVMSEIFVDPKGGIRLEQGFSTALDHPRPVAILKRIATLQLAML